MYSFLTIFVVLCLEWFNNQLERHHFRIRVTIVSQLEMKKRKFHFNVAFSNAATHHGLANITLTHIDLPEILQFIWRQPYKT